MAEQPTVEQLCGLGFHYSPTENTVHPGRRSECPKCPKFSTLAAQWLYDRPTLTVNERDVVARFAQWLDERVRGT